MHFKNLLFKNLWGAPIKFFKQQQCTLRILEGARWKVEILKVCVYFFLQKDQKKVHLESLKNSRG